MATVGIQQQGESKTNENLDVLREKNPLHLFVVCKGLTHCETYAVIPLGRNPKTLVSIGKEKDN